MQINSWIHTKNKKISNYKTTTSITHPNKYLKTQKYGYQNTSFLTYTVGTPSYNIHTLLLTFHPTPQSKPWKGRKHMNVKSKNILLKTTRRLT